jgi:poly-gamma-glutamate synthesis protein (capsule biosynthesis protein)
VEQGTGKLVGLRMISMQARRMRLQHSSTADAAWLRGVLERISRRFGSRFALEPDGVLALEPT